MEITGKAQTLASLTQHFVEAFLALAIVYFVISIVLERVLLLFERRLLKHEQREEGTGGRSFLRGGASNRQLSSELEGGAAP